MGQHPRGNRGSQGRDRRRESPKVESRDTAVINAVITEGGKILVETAEQLAQELSEIKSDRDKLSTSQIRNIYGAVKKMQMKGELDTHKLLMLKPKLAYAAERHGRGLKILKEYLMRAIDLVGNNWAKFNRFVDFFEAILAYHRAYGGK